MADIKLFVVLSFVITAGCPMNNRASASSSCETAHKRIQPELYTAEDGKEYRIINFPNFVQDAVAVECLPNQSCSNEGTTAASGAMCQQDYKLHQFMSVPAGKQLFQLAELQFRLFSVPYGCKCSP